METKDAFLAASSLAIILIIALAALLAIAFLFTLGSPLLLIGALAALGILAIPIVIGALLFFFGLWYVVFMLMKNAVTCGVPEKKTGNYTLERIKKA